MSFDSVADKFSFAVSYLAFQRMNVAFAEGYEVDMDSINRALFDAKSSFDELIAQGHSNVVNVTFWTVTNSTFFFSPISEMEDHQEMIEDVFNSIVNYGDVAITEDDEDEDEVFEYTSDKEFLSACLNQEAVTPNN